MSEKNKPNSNVEDQELESKALPEEELDEVVGGKSGGFLKNNAPYQKTSDMEEVYNQ